MVTYLSAKFQSIWRTSDFGRNLAQNMIEKDVGKINIKMEISRWTSTSLGKFSQFEKLQVLGPNLPERIWITKNLKK